MYLKISVKPAVRFEIAENGFINRMHSTFIAHSPSCAFDEWKGKKK